MEAYYILSVALLELFLLIVFLVTDFLFFYVFFESILPFLFLIIGLYGALQKFRAGYYIFLYTLFASLFMLLSFMKVEGDSATTDFLSRSTSAIYQSSQEIFGLSIFFSFSVKTPLV